MGRPKKNTQSIDSFTMKIAQAVCEFLEQVEKQYGEKITQNLKEKIFNTEFIHTCSKGAFRHWYVAYDWLIKLEWDSKHKIPEKKSISDALKPQGILLQKYFKMAERCLTYCKEDGVTINGESLPYNTANEWIKNIIGEFLYSSFLQVATLKIRETKEFKGNVKDHLVAIERKRLALIKSTYNSLSEINEDSYSKSIHIGIDKLPYEEFIYMDALKELLICSMFLAIESDRFRNDYWKPFLKQYTTWIAMMNSPKWQVITLKSDNKGHLTDLQHDSRNNQVILGDLAALKKMNFIRHTQQGFQDFSDSFFLEGISDYDSKKIEFLAPRMH